MIRCFFFLLLASQAHGVFKHSDCKAECGPGLNTCKITRIPERSFSFTCGMTDEECKKAMDPSSVCIDFFDTVTGNAAIWPDFQEWKATRPAVASTVQPEPVRTTSLPETSSPTSVESATIAPTKSIKTSTTIAPTTTSQAASSTSTTPPTTRMEESPAQGQATKGSQVYFAGIGLFALVLLAIASCVCCRKSKATPRVNETPLKMGCKDLTELEKSIGCTGQDSAKSRSAFVHL